MELKRKMLILFLLINFWNSSVAQERYAYRVENVMEGIYVLHPEINDYRWVTANIIVIINQRDVLVIDSGLLPSAAVEAIEEIRKLTNKPVKYLVNTHWHGDHWQGNETFIEYFPDIEIIASKEGSDGIKRDGMVWVEVFYLKYFERMIANYQERLDSGTKADDTVLTKNEKTEIEQGIDAVKVDLAEMKKIKPRFPTITFSQQLNLRSGDREIQIHQLGRGNTKGDAIVYLPNEKVLITGDLVVHPSPYESGSFSLEWLETSRKLAAFKYEYLLPGHGNVQHDTSYLDFLNVLFEEIILQVNQAYLKGNYLLEEFQALVNHESVTRVIAKEPRFAEHLKKLDSRFIPTCVERIHRRAHDGKLVP
ncbi:MAG TPA: MBL fold metallo-hydrolase [Cyclobacteriaceae bacterium]|nr:MBL fold metallo-hydrolase [Cyclobacteriaceae bacterium]